MCNLHFISNEKEVKFIVWFNLSLNCTISIHKYAHASDTNLFLMKGTDNEWGSFSLIPNLTWCQAEEHTNRILIYSHTTTLDLEGINDCPLCY